MYGYLRRGTTPPQVLVRLGLVVIVAALAVAVYLVRSSSGELNASAAAEGHRLFATNCTPCHGEKGDRVPIAPLNSKEFLDSRGDATLVHVISEGKGVMPAWGIMRGGPLSADQISAVVAYLNSSAGRTSPTILAGSGRALFLQNCARCHGEKGDRIPVAPLAAKPFLDSRTDANLFDTISAGKGMMPAFRSGSAAPFSEDQVRAVISYLRYNADASLADEARRGRDLYVNNCLACHGERGDRVPNVALGSPQHLSKLGDGMLTSVIVEGKGVMPGFSPAKGGTFQISDVGALLAYLKSWAGLPAGSALVGLEMPSQGRDLYMKNCTGCHGDSGDKVPGVLLKGREFLSAISDETLIRQITQGNTRGMPAWGKISGGPLSDGDIKNIVSYLRSPVSGTAAASGQAAVASTVAPATEVTIDPALAAKGKALFGTNCAACHGDTGDKVAQAKLADAAWLQQRGDAALIQSITAGKGAMPSWGKEKGGPLSQDEIGALLAYLKSAAGAGAPAAPAAGAALSASAMKGKDTFTKSCAMCHGESRDKLATAKLADAAWLNEKGDAALTQAITAGKGAMPAWGGKLSADDIAAVLAYLKEAAGIGQAAPAANSNTGAPARPAPTPAPVAPALALSGEAAKGKDLFDKNCAACHGSSRDKVASAKLADAAWLQQQGDVALSQAIANGKGAMPSWGQAKGGPLSTDDIAALLAYLKAMAGGS